MNFFYITEFFIPMIACPKKHQEGPHGTPKFIELLSTEDKEKYEKLQGYVGSPNYRYNRNHRIDTLKDLFNSIREYCEHDNDETEKWKRYLVCGICWFNQYVAINTKQLRLLISKSKSSINGALLKMGYKTCSLRGEQASLLFQKIPFLFEHYREFRQWSIRKLYTCGSEEMPIKHKKKIYNQDEAQKMIKEDITCTSNDDDENIKDDKFYDELFKDFDWNEECEKSKKEDMQTFAYVNFNNSDNNIFEEKYDDIDFDFEYNPFSIRNLTDTKDELDEVSSYNNKYEECSIIC